MYSLVLTANQIESMRSILTPQYLRTNAKKLAKNKSQPLTAAGQASFSQFLLISGEANHKAFGELLKRNIVFHTMARPESVSNITFQHLFDPLHAPKAVKTGGFTANYGVGKTSYIEGIKSNCKTVFPCLLDPGQDLYFNAVASLYELKQDAGSFDHLHEDLTDLFLQTISGSTTNTGSLHSLRDSFRSGKHLQIDLFQVKKTIHRHDFPSCGFLHNRIRVFF